MKNIPDQILESTKFVVEKSEFVKINEAAIKKVARKWKEEKWELPPWDSTYHFFDNSPRTLAYFFILDSINFSFWSERKEQKYRIHYQGKYVNGYNSLALSLKMAFSRHHPIEKNGYLLKMTKGEFLTLLGGKGKLALLEKRLHILHQAALIIKNQFGGDVQNLFIEANNNALLLLDILISRFPSFRDEAQYKEKRVLFYKRAQIFVNDAHAAFKGKGLGAFTNMDKLTAFSDYKIPQILRHWNIFSYGEALSKKIDAKIELQKNSPEEVEIRANTIWAMEHLKEELKTIGVHLQSREIDWLLWKKAGSEKGMKPYHKVRTTSY